MQSDMTGLQLHPYEPNGAGADDGLDAFRPAAFLNDITTLLDASNDATGNTAHAETAKVAKKRKANASPGSPKKSRNSASTKAVKKTHLVPSSPASKETKQAASLAVPELVASNGKSFDKKIVDPAEESALKSIAQAAINALIDNVNTKDKRPAEKVDTSTAHVKALTGNNWVHATSNMADAAPTTMASSSASLGSKGSHSSANRAVRRQPLTADERASQNRDRNREHARNTRLRKKAYVDELKKTLVELVAQRDEADQATRRMAQMEVEQKEVRFRVIEEFLKLRGSNETNFSRWSAILDEKFSLTLPVTRFRQMVVADAEYEQVICGATECMADAACLSAFLRTFGNEAKLQYECDREGFVMDGTNGILDWTAAVDGTGLKFKGNFRGTFCPSSNKLVSAKLMFDTGAIHAKERPSMKRNVSMVEIERASADDGSEADAILSSIGIPRVVASPAMTGNMIAPSVGSSSGSEKDDVSCTDGSLSGSIGEKQEA